MNLPLRATIVLVCWSGAAAAGWWWHRTNDSPQIAGQAAAPEESSTEQVDAPAAQVIARRVAAIDPMGLNRAAPAAPGAPAAGMPEAQSITWRLTALVVRGPERYGVWTAKDQKTLRLGVGEKLPDGDRIKSIHVDHIEIQSPRGRPRTLYLVAP